MNFAKTDHLRCSCTHLSGGAHFFDDAVFKHCFYSLIDAGIKLFSIAKNEVTWSLFALRSATQTCHDNRSPRLANRSCNWPLVTLLCRCVPRDSSHSTGAA